MVCYDFILAVFLLVNLSRQIQTLARLCDLKTRNNQNFPDKFKENK